MAIARDPVIAFNQQEGVAPNAAVIDLSDRQHDLPGKAHREGFVFCRALEVFDRRFQKDGFRAVKTARRAAAGTGKSRLRPVLPARFRRSERKCRHAGLSPERRPCRGPTRRSGYPSLAVPVRWRDVDRAAKRGENGQRFAELGRRFAGLQLDEETQANA